MIFCVFRAQNQPSFGRHLIVKFCLRVIPVSFLASYGTTSPLTCISITPGTIAGAFSNNQLVLCFEPEGTFGFKIVGIEFWASFKSRTTPRKWRGFLRHKPFDFESKIWKIKPIGNHLTSISVKYLRWHPKTREDRSQRVDLS